MDLINSEGLNSLVQINFFFFLKQAFSPFKKDFLAEREGYFGDAHLGLVNTWIIVLKERLVCEWCMVMKEVSMVWEL